MKKLLLTLIAAIALCGTVSAQYHSDVYDHYFTWDSGLGDYDYVIPFIQINGEYITLDDNYEAFELGAFIDGEGRGGSFLIDDDEDYPFTEISVYRLAEDANQTITFELYDHEHNVRYVSENTLINGVDYMALWWGEYDDVPILNFTPVGNTKHIHGYAAAYDEVENPHDNYYLIASPVINSDGINPADIEGMTAGGFDLYYFNQSGDAEQKEWITYKGEEPFSLMNGVGYLYAHDETIDLTFSGEDYEGDGNVALVYDAAAYWKGWNLVGNPFPGEAYADRAYYALQNGPELVPTQATTAVGAMEGIFVVAENENDAQMSFSRTAKAKGSSVSLNVSRANRMLDRTIVNFGGNTQLPKFQLRSTSTKVYIPVDGSDYAIVSAEAMGELPVNFKAEKSGSYTISAQGEEVNFTYLHLIDNMTGADVDLLTTPSYSFNATTTDYAQRFRLLFATGSSVDGDTFAFVNGAGNLSIFGIEGEATLQVMDINGRVLSTENFSGSYEKQLNVAAGIYMLRLTNGDNVRVQKMVIR